MSTDDPKLPHDELRDRLRLALNGMKKSVRRIEYRDDLTALIHDGNRRGPTLVAIDDWGHLQIMPPE